MFNGRHTYCTGTHESAKPIATGAQAFGHKKEGIFRLPGNLFPPAATGLVEKINPQFNDVGTCLLLSRGISGS